MSQASICILITIFVYLLGMVAVGVYYARQTASASDFFLGGRTLGPFVTAMSAEASDMSSYLVMFWKRTTLPGAVAGMAAGGIMVFVWKYLIRPLGGIWGIYELLPAFVAGTVIIVLVSLMTEKPSEEIEAEFELARQEIKLP